MRVLALALVCLVVPALSFSNGPPLSLSNRAHVVRAECPSRFDLNTFAALADRYAAGDDAPVETIGDCPWMVARLRGQLNPLKPAPVDARLAMNGAMLLLDGARHALRNGRLDSGPLLDTASRLLEASGQPSKGFAGHWYAAVARWLRAVSQMLAAERLLAGARRWMPDNSAVLYESGVTAELLAVAYERRERVHGEVTPRTPLVDRTAPLGDPRRQLAAAAEYFDTILNTDPLQDLVSVRLAHVLLLQDNTARARQAADLAAAHAQDGAIVYLAELLAGAACERDGDLAAAATRYERALARYAGGQSARIALSEVLQRQGQHDAARAALEPLLSLADGPREPWWVLMLDSDADIDAALASLRQVARS